MPKLAANLSWIYQEVPLLQRFGAAAAHGFKAVEILFPYEAPAADIAAELKKHKLTQALFNLPPGDWSKGERGIGALPGREAEFAAALDKALDYAKVLECRTLHVMSGMIVPGADKVAMHRTFVSNLKKACDRTAKSGLTLVLEPINHRDIPGYFTNTTTQVMSAMMNSLRRRCLSLRMPTTSTRSIPMRNTIAASTAFGMGASNAVANIATSRTVTDIVRFASWVRPL